jgi:hypothetical protein
MVEIIKKINKLHNFLRKQDGIYQIDVNNVYIKMFLQEKGQNCYESQSYFFYDVNTNLLIFHIKEFPMSYYEGFPIEPDKKRLILVFNIMKDEARKKVVDDFLNEMSEIRINEIINGKSLMLEKSTNHDQV